MERMIKNSSFETIISKSDQVCSGTPVVYQLKTETEKFGTLTKVTFGKNDAYKTKQKILLVGETGAGKSILINALVNYMMGVKWEDEVWFQIVKEEEHQTSDIVMYEIFGFEDKILPYSLSIIDTPGFGDTRGIKNDFIVSQRLFDLFRSEDGVHEIHAVGLVMKATDNRLSDRLMYVLDSVMSLFGKDIENNIVALITHSNGRTPKSALQALEVANIKCAKNETSQPVYFLFNNQQNEDRTTEAEYLEGANKISERGVREFTIFVKEAVPQKLNRTTEVLKKRIRLTACIQNLQDRIRQIEHKQTEIKQIQENLKKHDKELKENEKFTIYVDEPYKIKTYIPGGKKWFIFLRGAVTCNVCEENCHYPGCKMAWSPALCEVMKKGHCTVCTGNCPASVHVKNNFIYENQIRRVKKTLPDVKQKYETKSTSDNNVSLLKNLEEDKKNLSTEKSKLVDEAYHHVMSLEQIALKVDSVSTNVHLDFLIEKMRETKDTGKVQKLEEIKRKVDEGTKAALRYKHVSEKGSRCSKDGEHHSAGIQ
ncbi:uncharacterized protein LOC108249696 isoform X1 [Kryptolebias marmoratus]|uniref:Septin-2-like n=1 Tax=Kryptolebias marmoratus TaxID=37003 RepID=A0A3Q2ZZR6_KRYMA|nr:uncharacterized protein LOC108249696 isoform X1 [Kryptolebias marmoratus]